MLIILLFFFVVGVIVYSIARNPRRAGGCIFGAVGLTLLGVVSSFAMFILLAYACTPDATW